MILKFKIFFFVFLATIFCNCSANTAESKTKHYLLKPSGEYCVSFEDIHLLNTTLCPDPNFNGKNDADFSSGNKVHCHEIMVRIYYPTRELNQKAPYNSPFIKQLQDNIKNSKDGSINLQQSLNEIYSNTSEKKSAIDNKAFPIIFFSPGLGCSVQTYENIITELVSHGYIVAGVNTPFLSGSIELPNHYIVKPVIPRSTDEIEKSFINIQSKDLEFCINNIKNWKHLRAYKNMDFIHVGAFGHSIGGRIVANLTHSQSNKLQAAAAMDTAIDPSGDSLRGFAIPFMHEIAANKLSISSSPLSFVLNQNGFLVHISPSPNDKNYSYHMNFSDFSTLQYQPAVKVFLNSLKQNSEKDFNIKIHQNSVNDEISLGLDEETYLLAKRNSKWELTYYKGRKKIIDLDIMNIKGLSALLAPLNKPKELNAARLKQVKFSLTCFRKNMNELVGIGNGWELTKSINTHLIAFFDTFLKGQDNISFKQCQPLTTNVYIKCNLR